jgi:hypothetical protein
MASQAFGAKTILLAAGVGSGTPSADWSIHVSKLPATPDRAIAIFDSGGAETADPRWLLDYRTIQVLVRGGKNDYNLTYNTAAMVKDALLGLEAQVVGGDRWDGVTMIGDITFVSRDDNDRPTLSVNFRIIVEPATNALTNREVL